MKRRRGLIAMPILAKKKHKIAAIIGIIVAVLLILVALLAIWQHNNIKAVMDYSRYTPKELSKKLESNQQTLIEQIKQYAPNLLREMTAEEKEQIASGKKTQEEVISNIVKEQAQKIAAGQESSSAGVTSVAKGSTTSNKEDSSKANMEKIISRHTAQVYVVKSEFVGRLEGLESAAKAEYIRTMNQTGKAPSKSQMISKYLGQAASLEKQCDGEMNQVLSSLKTELKKNNMDTSIVNTIRSEYENEKSLKKAQYMSRLNNK